MATVSSSTDRIEKRITLKAPQARVWRALADSGEFGTWFQMRFDQPFAPGRTVRAQVLVKGYEHVTADFQIVSIEPEHYFSYRWHPYPMDPTVDYSKEPTTLVEFKLEEEQGGASTAVTIVESGFDKIPLNRRAEAFRKNDNGWAGQATNLARYVEQS